jgi:hypothetical protein
MMYNNKNQKKNYGYFNKQKNGGNEKWDFDCKLFHVWHCNCMWVCEKKRKKGSHNTEFVVRDGDLEYESSICWMVT